MFEVDMSFITYVYVYVYGCSLSLLSHALPSFCSILGTSYKLSFMESANYKTKDDEILNPEVTGHCIEVVVNCGKVIHQLEDANEGEGVTYYAKEQHNLSLMRAFVESRDPSSKEVDDLTLRRFLRARNLDMEKAALLFLKYLQWKKSFVPKGYISEAEIQYDVAQNKTFLGGFDKKGRPIAVVYGSKHFQNSKPGGIDDFKRFCIYTLDKIISRMPPGQEKFVAIGDVKGWGYSNSDIRGYLGALSVMQDCYPERLGKLFIVHAPKIFMTVWKMIYPFIDENTKTKIAFVDKKQLKSRLLEDIDESQLPDIYGGKLPLTPIQEA